MDKAVLALENGSIYKGYSIASKGEKIGWVSFNTGIVGYQEIITTPANAGKIIVMTYPLIGNYGISKKFMESDKPWINGLIIKEKSRISSNWQSEENFDAFLKKRKVLCMQNLDTRALTIELREQGEQFGIISTKDFNVKSLQKKIKESKDKKINRLKNISVKNIKKTNTNKGTSKSIAILDIGVTKNIINQLNSLDCNITILPYNTPSDAILKMSLEKLIIPDGPEQDIGLNTVINTTQNILGQLPILGIGTGCQILAQALGSKTKRMHLGHHGLNYPILESDTLKGFITVQNHSFIIDETSLNTKDIKVIWRNANDKTIEGIECKKYNVTGYQFNLFSPGLNEINPFLKKFII